MLGNANKHYETLSTKERFDPLLQTDLLWDESEQKNG